MKKLILLLTLLLISGVAAAGLLGGRGMQTSTTTPSVITAVGVTPNTFVEGSADGTSVGAVSVSATGSVFGGTVAIGPGGQGSAFRLSSATLPSNLLLNGVQLAGTYTVNLIPTQAGFTNSGNAFSVTITGTAVTTGCSQANTFLARTSGLSQGQKDAYTTYVCGLVADGVIPNAATMASSGATTYCGPKLDALWVLATTNTTTANLDLCGHAAYTLVPNGSPNFTANQGYLGVDGSSTVYLNTGFNAATAAGNFSRDSASVGIWSLSSVQATGSGGTAIGAHSGSGNAISQIVPWYVDGRVYGAVNATGSGQANAAVSDAAGYHVVSRTASNVETLYKGGASLATDSSASQPLVSLPYYILARDTDGAAQNGAGLRIAMAHVGAGLSSGDVAALQARGCAYLTTVHGSCVPAQVIASIAPSTCSFTSAIQNGKVCGLNVSMNPAVPASTASLSLTGANTGGFHLIGSGCQNISVSSSSTPPSGQALVTSDGTWAWGSAAAGRPNEYNISLNGTNTGIGLLMQITGGQLYVNTASTGWYVWSGGSFRSASAPGAADTCIIEQSSASNGTPTGTYTDVTVTATQPGIGNSPFPQPLTLIGSAAVVGATPAPATAAGFTTLAFSADFSQPFYANRANWLDCAGASSPQWYLAWVGFGGNIAAPCSATLQETDPASGLPALHMYWQDNFYDASKAANYNMIQLVDSSGNGPRFPAGAYYEVTARYDQPVSNAQFDIWSYTPDMGGIEYDGIEVWTSTDTDGGSAWHCCGTANGFGSASGVDSTQYNKWAWRVTSDGSQTYFCVYINDVSRGCLIPPLSGGQFSMTETLQLLVGMSCRGGLTPPCNNGRQINLWVSSARVFSCTGMNSGATCFTSTPNP